MPRLGSRIGHPTSFQATDGKSRLASWPVLQSAHADPDGTSCEQNLAGAIQIYSVESD